MIKARIRWCSCRVENILTLGKLLRLWFCFLLHSILFFISQTSYCTYKIISSYELACPIMGTIFLENNSSSIFLSVVGAYVVRTSSLNYKHCCQLFRMGLRDKTAPTLTTPLIRVNMGCAVATILSSLAFLSSSVSMANLNSLVAASFPNLRCLLATTFSSLRFLSPHCCHLASIF